MYNTVGDNLSRILEDKRMTYIELSRRTGITEVSISRYARSLRIPNAINLAKIAKALGIPTDELLRENK